MDDPTIVFLSTLPIIKFGPLIFAYLDPGTGSIILQAIIGVFFGLLFTVKLWWHRLKAMFTKLFKGRESDRDDRL